MRADDRAYIPPEGLEILTRRTLGNSHPVLPGLLKPDLSVLDVGCGPGTLTVEIARLVDPGHVVGMDANAEMIAAAEAASPPGEVPNLVFYRGDIRESAWEAEFDLANAARVLQWIPEAALAVRRMARAVRPGGVVVLLDYDHTRARWSDAPAAWRRFYEAFLTWRAAGALDNAVAERLPALLEGAGLAEIEVHPQVEVTRAGEADFFRAAGTWRMVVESRGRQMVSAGHLAEEERRAAFETFTGWMQQPGATQTLHLTCAVARRPASGPPPAGPGPARGRNGASP